MRRRPLTAVYFTSSQELRSHMRCIHKMKGDGNCYFRAISFILTGVEKSHLVMGRSSCSAYGKGRNWSETWGISRQPATDYPKSCQGRIKYLICRKTKKYVKHETYLEIDSMIYITEKLKGAEKVAMQVLHVVMTYDCKENTCNGKKNTHIYIMYIRKYWVGSIHCLPTQCHDWVGSCPPCPLGSRALVRCGISSHPEKAVYFRLSFVKTLLFNIMLMICSATAFHSSLIFPSVDCKILYQNSFSFVAYMFICNC